MFYCNVRLRTVRKKKVDDACGEAAHSHAQKKTKDSLKPTGQPPGFQRHLSVNRTCVRTNERTNVRYNLSVQPAQYVQINS